MKNIIIIGAGIAGLTAGIYARQSGFSVTIYESHGIPGGASTSWRRKGYLFEGGMHWLTGSSPATALNKLWHEVGALNDTVPVYNRDPFFAIEYKGRTAHLYRDVDKLREHFIELSPEDKSKIQELCKDIKKFEKVGMPLSDIKGVKTKQKASMPVSSIFGMLPAFARMSFYARQTAEEYSEGYKSPVLKMLLQNVVGPDNNAVALLFTLATLASGDGGYPEGGSLGMANRMADYFKSLGGTIQYKKAVSKIAVQDGEAKAVIVEGERIPADGVIVTKDTLVAVDALFDPPLREDWAVRMRKDTEPVLNTFISVGVEADLSDLPERITFLSEEPLLCAGVPSYAIGVNNYAGYKGYAPEGCTAITSIIMGDSYAYWKECREKGTYEEEKQKLAQNFIRLLSKKYPVISGKAAVWDVATPLTYERYLGSYKGSWMTRMGKGKSKGQYPIKPETIKNVYFAGQRLQVPGGLPVAAETGRRAVQYLCRDNDMVFQGLV